MRLVLADPGLDAAVAAVTEAWTAAGSTRRLCRQDANLWTGGDEARWLGWLEPARSAAALPEWLQLASDARAEGLTSALVLGMGGSSLFPLVLARTFGTSPGGLALRVLDSTDPAEVLAAERSVDLGRSLVLVASKSGSTLEPTLFMERLLGSVGEAIGPAKALSRFIAVTDPGSSLEKFARDAGFRAIVAGNPSIGGRFSALSPFGLVPGALSGAPVEDIVASARAMAARCAETDASNNPGARLGCALAALAAAGRDKITLAPSTGLAAIGAWIEQLVAESTGKLGKGLVPIDGERLAAPSGYGNDRVFVAMTLGDDHDAARRESLAALERAGHPVIHLDVPRPADLGGLAYAWEFATAVAGSIMGLHPFDQPDVESAKIATRELMTAFERTGEIPRERVLASDGALRLEGSPGLGGDASFDDLLAAHLGRLGAGDYFAILAFLPETPQSLVALDRMRLAVRDARRVATSVGFGPRFLHSTGQLHLGGPGSGVYLQLTVDDADDAAIPGRPPGFTFSMVKAAQAGGNLRALGARDRRVLRVHVSGNVADGLDALASRIERLALTLRETP